MKILKSNEFNFSQALVAMKTGKHVINFEGDAYRIFDGSLQRRDPASNNFCQIWDACALSGEEILGPWQLEVETVAELAKSWIDAANEIEAETLNRGNRLTLRQLTEIEVYRKCARELLRFVR